MPFDRDRIVAETPGKSNVIHLNNAGSSLMPQSVLSAQVDHLNLEASIGGYEASKEREAAVEAVYSSVARLINCHAEEVAIVENATVGWCMAFYAIPFEAGDRILTVEAEYASNYLAYLQMANRRGVTIDVIPSGDDGRLDLEALEAMIDDRVKLISVTHVPTNSGLVNPVAAIGKIARAHNILYLVDACQSAGQIPLDVEEINCDMLSVTARKYLRGPRGVGFLYVRQRIIEQLEPPMIDLFSADWLSPTEYRLRADARRFENWENNYAAKLGMGAAIDYALEIGVDVIQQKITELADYLRAGLSAIDSVHLHTVCPEQCGIVSFSVTGLKPEDIQSALSKQRINVSITTPFSTLIDAQKHNLPNLVRASVHYFNDRDEIDIVCLAVQGMAARQTAS